MNTNEIVSAVIRSEQARCEQIGRWESLDVGVAHYAPQWPSQPDANQLRHVLLADQKPNEVYQSVEAFYAQHDTTCHLWTLSAEQATEPLENLLLPKGWQRQELLAMGWKPPEKDHPETNESIRILPARAMHKTYRQALLARQTAGEAFAQVSFERLEDANYDAFLAMVNKQVAGWIGYLEVGDIARLSDFWILPRFIDSRAGQALITHFLNMARRLLPRLIVACLPQEQQTHVSLLKTSGFFQAGTLTQFRRPT